MKNKYLNLLFFISILMLKGCNKNSKKQEITIIKQEVAYDSINSKNKLFSVKLFTEINFKNLFLKEIILERTDYNNFYMIFRKDTFPLVPRVNSFKKNLKKGDSITISYITDLYHKESEYDNQKLLNEIKICSIKQYNTQELLTKSSIYTIESIISLWAPPPTSTDID